MLVVQHHPKPEIEPSPQVVRYARANGVDREALSKMLRLSARCTSPKGNRRYYEWVFNVVDGVAVYMSRIEAAEERPQEAPEGSFIMYEECEECYGEGTMCRKCKGEGLVRVVRRECYRGFRHRGP